jgi:hypothetical protein
MGVRGGVVFGVEIGLFDTGLGKGRPERPVGFLHFEENETGLD